jgi:hypothetical protein
MDELIQKRKKETCTPDFKHVAQKQRKYAGFFSPGWTTISQWSSKKERLLSDILAVDES